MNNLSSKQEKHLNNFHKLYNTLSDSERLILDLAIQDYSTKQIAAFLNNSPKTIGHHMENISKKANYIFKRPMEFRRDIIPRMHCYYFITNIELLPE